MRFPRPVYIAAVLMGGITGAAIGLYARESDVPRADEVRTSRLVLVDPASCVEIRVAIEKGTLTFRDQKGRFVRGMPRIDLDDADGR